MPAWAQWVLGAAALVTAIKVLWTVIGKLSTIIVLQRELQPVLIDLLKQFEDSPGAFKVLKEMSQEFRSDSGSTLKDQMNRLEHALELMRLVAKAQAVSMLSQAELAADDRAKLGDLLLRLDRLNVKSDDAKQERTVIREALAKKEGDT